MKFTTSLFALLTLASQSLAAPTPSISKRDLVFMISTEANGAGQQMSWVVDRWKCHNLADDNLDNVASWAFVTAGLANGCTLYDANNCTGAYANIPKYNGNILDPRLGPVNLTDVGFDDMASSFSCY